MDIDLWNRISAYIAGASNEEFDELACALFRRQYALNDAYRRYVDNLGIEIDRVRSWRDIPAVPAQAFKAMTLSCAPVNECATVFYSSGTTQNLAGKHFMDPFAVSQYNDSLGIGYTLAMGEDAIELPLWAIMPPPSAAPNSSLSHMLNVLGAEEWFWDDEAGLSKAFGRLQEPLVLFGTSFAFVSLFDSFPDRSWPLPDGSAVITTGGFKGRTREVARDEFYALLRDRFALADAACVSEYGMSEMASQFWSVGEQGAYVGPPWLRTRIIDPETGSDARDGEPGLLRVYDLANWNSVLAIQTQDMAVASEDGFRLLGRAPDAEVRGCSLTVEELWTRQ